MRNVAWETTQDCPRRAWGGKVMDTETIARIAHEVNRVYCLTIGDKSQPRWEDAPQWQKESAINGVEYLLGVGDYWRDNGKFATEVVDKFRIQFDEAYEPSMGKYFIAKYYLVGDFEVIFRNYDLPNYFEIEFEREILLDKLELILYAN